MTVNFVLYETEGNFEGRIAMVGSAGSADQALIQSFDGCELLFTLHPADDTTDWVVEGQIAKRPTFPYPARVSIAANGEDQFRFDAVPEGSLVTVDGEAVEIEEGSIVIQADMPGTYAIRFECWPYTEHTAIVEAV